MLNGRLRFTDAEQRSEDFRWQSYKVARIIWIPVGILGLLGMAIALMFLDAVKESLFCFAMFLFADRNWHQNVSANAPLSGLDRQACHRLQLFPPVFSVPDTQTVGPTRTPRIWSGSDWRGADRPP
jgi:hypothetical protein